MTASLRSAPTSPSARVESVQLLLTGLGAVGVVLAVLGAFFWCENSMAILASVAVTSAAAAVAAALPVSGAIAQIAAAVAAGSVVGTAALGLTFLALGQSGCVEIG